MIQTVKTSYPLHIRNPSVNQFQRAKNLVFDEMNHLQNEVQQRTYLQNGVIKATNNYEISQMLQQFHQSVQKTEQSLLNQNPVPSTNQQKAKLVSEKEQITERGSRISSVSTQHSRHVSHDVTNNNMNNFIFSINEEEIESTPNNAISNNMEKKNIITLRQYEKITKEIRGELLNGRLYPLITRITQISYKDDHARDIKEILIEKTDLKTGKKTTEKERYIYGRKIKEDVDQNKTDLKHHQNQEIENEGKFQKSLKKEQENQWNIAVKDLQNFQKETNQLKPNQYSEIIRDFKVYQVI